MRAFVLLPCLLLGCSDLGLGSSSQSASCPDSPATDVFAETVCVCEDFTDVGNLIVGRSVANDRATLAVNGRTTVLNNTQVRGTFIPYGGLEAKANVEVTEAIQSAGDVDALGNVEAGTDLEVGGNLTGVGRIAVDGTLRVGGEDRFLGWREIASEGAYGTTPAPPCGCSDAEIFDVVGAVAAARAQNDNAAAGLPTAIAAIGWTDVRLQSGSYFFDDVRTIGATRLTIDGNVAIYIDGNLDNIGAEWIRLNDGATLDLYVSGAVRTIGHVVLGDKWAPSSFRLYIGGTEEAAINVGNQMFNGAIYAPRAPLRYIGNTNIRGALTARTLLGVGNLVVGYAAPDAPPDQCEPPGAEPEPDAELPPDEAEDPPVVL